MVCGYQPYLVTSPRRLLAVFHLSFIHSLNKNGYIYSILGNELYARDAGGRERHGLCSLAVDSLAVSIRDTGPLSTSIPTLPFLIPGLILCRGQSSSWIPLCSSAEVAPKPRGASGLQLLVPPALQ